MTRTLKMVCSIALMVSFMLSACSTTEEAPTEEKPIQIALTQDMLSFDPIKTTDIFSEAVLRCVYTSLYDFDEELRLRPKLVKSETLIDETTWKIEIHDGVKFHDGSSLTTDDVIFSIERAMTGERTQKLLEMVDRVEKLDNTTFLIYAKEPYADLLSLFAKAETSIVSKTVVGTPGYDYSMPVGAGPFKLISREVNEKISLERFDDCYLGKAAGRYLTTLHPPLDNPKVDELIKQGRGQTDADKKRQIYEEINKIVTEEAPIVILQNPMILSAALDNIEGIHFNSQGLIQYEALYRK